MRLLFATHNRHKTDEIRDIFLFHNLPYEVLSLADLEDYDEIVEDGVTMVDNALLKARAGFQRHGINCFADDTGLEVEALNGEPGVYSARYAGPECSADNNIDKLLSQLEGVTNRKARFRTVVALVLNGAEYLFEGAVDGQILSERRGVEGFGYDPIFQPNGYEQTFAEMSEAEKNRISHRGKATEKLLHFLKIKGI